MLPMVNHVWSKDEIEFIMKNAKQAEHTPKTIGDKFLHFLVGFFKKLFCLGYCIKLTFILHPWVISGFGLFQGRSLGKGIESCFLGRLFLVFYNKGMIME